MKEDVSGGLTADEEAYFASEGATHFEKEAPEPAVEPTEPAATVEPEPPAPEADPETERDDKGRFVKTVPHQTFHAEREERKKAQQEAAQAREALARLEERWKATQPAEQPKAPETPFDGIEDDDYVGTITALKQHIASEAKQRAEQTRVAQEAQQQNEVFNAHLGFVRGHINEAISADPSVKDAFDKITESYERELVTLGYQGQALEQARQQVLQNVVFAASNAIQRNVPAAEFVKNLAQTRGWSAAQPAPKVELPDNLKKVADAQTASRTIGKTAGAATGSASEIGIAELAEMPQPEFDAWMAVPANAARFKKLMGG